MADKTRAQVASLRNDRLMRTEGDLSKGAAVLAKREFVIGPTFDIVKDYFG
jgi:hypothetical protein